MPPRDPAPHRASAGPFVKLVAGWTALDFTNTVGSWTAGDAAGPIPGDDRLQSFVDVVRWSALASAISSRDASYLRGAALEDPRGAEEVTQRAIALRASLYGVFRSLAEHRPPPDAGLSVVGDEAVRLRTQERLIHRGGAVHTAWVAPARRLDAVLWPVLRSALQLMGDVTALDRLGWCDGARCGWLFLDTSRGRRRRWCDMADCGNLAKVRAHRSRSSRNSPG